MSSVKRILVVVDPTTEQQPAVEKAATLARLFAARVELFACETRNSREARLAKHIATGSQQPFEADPGPLLKSLAARVRDRGVEVTSESRYADPLHAAVLEHARAIGADLIVKDTHHHPVLKRTLITNTDWHLIRGCRMPLLLTKPVAWHQQPSVVAALDPLHTGDKPAVLDEIILQWSRDLAQRLEGSVHIAHAYMPLEIYVSPGAAMPLMQSPVTTERLMGEERRRRTQLLELARPFGVDERNIHLQIDSPEGFLPCLAGELPADVLVMGAISRSGMKRLFIGSTAEAVLEKLPCDALIVKPPDFADVLPF